MLRKLLVAALLAAPAAVQAAPMLYTINFSQGGFTNYPTYTMSGSFTFLFDRDAPPAHLATLAIESMSLNAYGVDYTPANSSLMYSQYVGGTLYFGGNLYGSGQSTGTDDFTVAFSNFLAAPVGSFGAEYAAFSRTFIFGIQASYGPGTGTLTAEAPPGSGDPQNVPEPAMLGLFGLGALSLGLARRRRA